ncbi:hypothetical protein [Fodinicurvata fenggangensis]|uniref:hypothetical protein n=1 Tax=Fodinicurvata fenggangensis TaxID=1121830 RepID=UPI0012DE0E36|nr:hypothetical protein [Fodinicurvata fenggangensis]
MSDKNTPHGTPIQDPDEAVAVERLISESRDLPAEEGALVRAFLGALRETGETVRAGLQPDQYIVYGADDLPEDYMIREYGDGRRVLIRYVDHEPQVVRELE